MARKKSEGGNPILVIFLVLFILLSIGLGVMYYTGLKQIDTANEAEKKAKTDLAAAQKAQEISDAKVKLYRTFIGLNDKNDLEALKSPVPNAQAELKAEHEALVRRANELLGVAAADVNKGADAKAWEDLRKRFNLTPQETFTWDWPAGSTGLAGGPTPTLLNRLVTVVAERERTFLESVQKQDNATAQGEEFKKAKKEYTDALATLSTQVQEQIKKLEVAIGKVEDDKKAAIETFEKSSADTRDKIRQKQLQLDEAGILLNDEKAKLGNIERQLQSLIDRQNELEESRRGAFVVNLPHGQITRRKSSDKMVEINIGSSAGLKRGQTFIVQPASARREGLSRRTKPGTDELISKGAIEVVDVIDANLARARITAETDDIRDSILEGDLLYNPLFKKNARDHVVLVGVFDTDADGIDDIATVARDLAKRGAIVDGYFDLNSGKWESPDPNVRRPGPGPNTTYVVRGWEFGVSPGEPEALGRAKAALRDQLSAALTEAKTKGAQEMRANRFLAEIGYPFSQSISDETVSAAAVKYTRDTPPPAPPQGPLPVDRRAVPREGPGGSITRPLTGHGSPHSTQPPMPPLFEFRHATVARGGVPAIRDFTWAVADGEAWAVVGPAGCGKSTLLETVAGHHRVVAGHFTPPPGVRLVPFRETSRLFSPERFYYQQRFEFADDADCPTVREYLTRGQAVGEAELLATAERVRIGGLLDLRMLKLSNGQTRRTRIARGLLAKPRLLVLDDPFSGLDVQGRAELVELLAELVRGGQGVLLACRGEDVPAGFRVLKLPGSPRGGGERTGLGALASASRRTSTSSPILIDLRCVTVRHGGKTILRDITWTVHAGERWAVLGPNGSGKTTLLSLICGDHPQAFANHVRVFGKQRGEETLWELKRRIGLVSPELHACFPRMRTAFHAAATGFEGHLTPTPHTPEQAAAVRRLFAEFGLADIADRPWWTLSAGTQRAVLFVRAVASTPPLVILDEPFQGMDADQIARLRAWLDTNLAPSQTLLMVTHREDELPACVTRRLTLTDGRVAGP